MALTTVNVKTTFDYTSSPKKFIFVDLSDYAGQGIALTAVAGVIKVVSPTGATIYNNTNFNSPDINPDVSLTNSTTINLPLDSSGAVLQGDYTITYTVRVNPTSLISSYDVSIEKETTHAYTSPTVSLAISANLVLPSMTSTDNTSYTRTNSAGSPVTPTIVRDHRLFYPPTTGAASINGTGSTVTTSTVYGLAGSSLQYSSELVSDLTYNFGNDFYVLDEVEGVDTFDLNVDRNLCNIYCGMRSLYQNWTTYKGTTRGDELLSKIQKVAALALIAQTAIDCGKSDDVSAYFSSITDLGGINEDCNCGDGTPTLLVGLGGSGTVVVAEGSGIDVAVSVSGTTTTYTVSIESASLTKLNNSYNSSVTPGDGISVTVTTDSDGNKIYKVINTSTMPNVLAVEYTMDFTTTAVPTITRNNYVLYGTKLGATAIANDNNGSNTDWQTNVNTFTVSSLFASTAVNYYITAELVETAQRSSISALGVPIQVKALKLAVITKGANSFQLQLMGEDGVPVSGLFVSLTYTQIKFNIKITA